MKERPILFSGPMVCAILEGRKTQTRRVIKPQPGTVQDSTWDGGAYLKLRTGNLAVAQHARSRAGDLCPYGKLGDRLWVRESFGFGWWGGQFYSAIPISGKEKQPDKVFYKADGHDESKGRLCWRPSIHMPRWASRIALEIINVRVERLQEITEAACVEEGVQVPVTTEGCPSGKARILTQLTGPGPHGAFAPCTYLPRDDDSLTAYSRAHFASGWDALNAKRGYSWKSNPWVWVVEFRKT